LQEQLQREDEEDEEDEVKATFILNTTSDQSLKQDYIAFSQVYSNCDNNSSSLDLGESKLYNLDKDYSWFRRYKGA